MTSAAQQLPRSDTKSFLIILALALVVRAVWIALIEVNPVSDSQAYDIFARNMALHGVFGFKPDEPGAYWAVGAPAIYAASYIVFGINNVAVIFVNMISTCLTLWLIYLLGRLYFNTTTALIATLIFALWPVTIQFSTAIASELHFMAAMLAALLFWEKAKLGQNFVLNIVICGVLFAAATYIRPVAQLIPVVLVILGLIYRDSPIWVLFAKLAVVLVAIFLLIQPWSARNERVFGVPVSISTNFGPNLWMGNHPGTEGGYTPLPEWTHEMGEIERSEKLEKVAVDYIKAEPVAFVTRTLRKVVLLHNRETIGVAWNSSEIKRVFGDLGETLMKIVSSLYWFAALGLTIAAVIYISWQGNARYVLSAPPFILILYLVAVHAVIVVEDRYHLPQIPLMALLAAAFLNATFFKSKAALD